ncbi:dihydrolipoamide dehydrogenase [Chlamydia trachomatis]|nr:dihydrolipoamide dehydrogenase [Chlamydia trachomatis]
MIHGWGRLVASNTVEVNGRQIVGKNIVLASGSYSKAIGQTITQRVMTSEQALHMNTVPRSAIVLGGGVIGVEFASIWESYGADVTIIEGLSHLVPNEDEAISKALERAFRKRKITFKTSTMFEKVEEHEHGVRVFTQDGQQFEAEYLLIAIGRGPATANLGYEENGIKLDRGFVVTDERLRTGVTTPSGGHVYAVGDIVPGAQLAHRGFLHGIFVAEDIAGRHPQPVCEDLIPKVTFCNPEIASVGLSEKKAKEKYGAEGIETVEFNLAGNGKSQILGTAGFVKLIRQKEGPIVGFTAIGARMGEQVGEGELMVAWQAYPEDFDALIHAHPTQNEAIGEAALALAGKSLHAHG